MTKNKKLMSGLLVVVGVGMLLSFQNCSQGGGDTLASIESVSDTSANSSSIISYPSISNYVYIKAGQKVTLKIQAPSLPNAVTNYVWYAYNDNGALMAHYGVPLMYNGYMYVNLTVRADVSENRDIRLLLYDFVNGTYLDAKGVAIYLTTSSSTTAYAQDYISEACNSSSANSPTFRFDRNATAAQALVATDNGAGFASASCAFGSTSVSCFATSAWPSNWSTQALTVSLTNRCGQSTSQSF